MRLILSAQAGRRHAGLIGVVLMITFTNPLPLSAAPVWCSPFETESGQPVTQDQIAGPVENAVGSPGAATAGAANLDPLLYIQHGQATPTVPAVIDPSSLAGSFALSTPDDRRTGINTNLRSDAGTLSSNLTFEGYFLMPSAEPITTPSLCGRRLVTQKRSYSDDNSRLAIGVHSKLVGVVEGLYDYEGFNYTGNVINGQAGGLGWSGGWVNSNGDFNHLTNDGVSLDSNAFPFAPVGSRISGVGGAAARNLSRAINGSDEGTVMYFSTLYRRGATTAGSSDIQFQFQNSALTTGFRVGNGSNGKFFVGMGSVTAELVYGPDVQPDTVYFLVAKVVTSASGLDQAFLNIYGPDDTVPATEPETWQLTASKAITSSLTRLRINIGAGNTNGQIDEMRIGSTYEAVTDPDAPLGNPGSLQNVLSTYWAEYMGSPEPTAATSHLELGTTPLEANKWYHFALTYNGTDIRWYLDGNMEGEVLSPNLWPAGTAKIVVANNRKAGVSDRGFYGVIDEIRIWDNVLPTSAMLVSGGGTIDSHLLWRSRFETQFGQAVTTGQAADTINCIDNSAGAPDGTPAGIVAMSYAQYGQTGVPAVPSSIDPSALTGSFVLSSPDSANAAIDTTIRSNAGDLASAMTAQGYFNTFQTIPGGTSYVAHRLVSTMRSSSQGSSRLGIGLTANVDAPETPTHEVLSVVWADPDSVLTVARGTTAIQPNTWYHFALVWDGTDIRFYLNGVLEGEVLGPNLIAAGTAPVIVGNDRANGAGTRGFYGLLDKIVISDHVIAPTEFMTAGFDPCLGVWCNVPFADADKDDDVDMLDFAIVQRCVTLSGIEIAPQCACFDRDSDIDIDVLDIDAFAKCATGPGVTWSAALTPDCNP